MINSLRGMRDFLDNDGALYERVVGVCAKVAQNFGFAFIETPKLEETALFRRSVGESSDIVGKEMYEFSDKGGESICLRPEGTAGVVRAFLQAKLDKIGGIKRWFYHGSMFRYERPQRGRQREFHQFGIECFGISDAREDAAIIILAKRILDERGIKATLKLNSLGNKESMSEFKTKLASYAKNCANELCEDCARRINTNILRILDCKNEKCQALLKDAPSVLDSLDDECKKDFELVQNLLKNAGVEYELDDRLVRGLDYYSKTAFEFVSDEIGAKAAVIGGGRYDGLISELGGKPTPAVGWAMGIERIMEILGAKESAAKRDGIYLCALEPAFIDEIFALGCELRKTHKVEISYEAKSPAKHLSLADKKGAKVFLCLGSDEKAKGEIWYKNLENKSEKRIKISELKGAL